MSEIVHIDEVIADSEKIIRQDINGNNFKKVIHQNLETMDEENSDLVNPISNSIMANPMTNQELMNPISKKDLSVEINKQFSVELHNEKNSEINQNIRKDQNTIEDQVVFLNSLVSPSLSTGYSGSESFESSTGSNPELDFNQDKDFQNFGENSGPSYGFSFISSLVSHCVSNAFEADASSLEIAKIGKMNDDESSLEDDTQLVNENVESECNEIPIIQDLTQDANNVSESYLQISVEFSDSESTCDSGPASFVEQEARFNQNTKRKESFLTELEVKTRSEFLLQIGTEILEKEHIVEPEITFRQEINNGYIVNEKTLEQAEYEVPVPLAEKAPLQNNSLVPNDVVDNNSILMISNKPEILPSTDFQSLTEDKSPQEEISSGQIMKDLISETDSNLLQLTNTAEEKAIQSEMFTEVDSSSRRVKKSLSLKSASSKSSSRRSSTSDQTEPTSNEIHTPDPLAATNESFSKLESETEEDEDIQTKLVIHKESQSGREKSTSSESSSRKSSISSIDQNEVKRTSGLSKWSSQQRLIILVDEKNPSEDGTATNITTDCDSTTIITITTAASTSTTTTATSQAVTQPSINIVSEDDFLPSTNQVSVSSKFVSCVDIEEVDENMTEKETNPDSEAEPLTVDTTDSNVEPGLELEKEMESESKTQPDTPESPGVFQYIFGCLPCCSNQK